MLEKENIQDERISLLELCKAMRSAWYWLAGGGALGIIVAGAAILTSSPIYEAVAIVQVGQVGQVGQVAQIGQAGQVVQHISVEVESAAQAIERMRSGGFQIEAAKISGYQPWLEDASGSARSGEKYFSLHLVRNTHFVEVHGKAGTREDAAKITKAMVDVLAKRHAELAAPTIDRLNRELVMAQERLNNIEKNIAFLELPATYGNVKNGGFSPIVLMASVLQQRQSEQFLLRQIISSLKAALAEPATQPAKAVEGVFVGDEPVSPRRGQIAFLGVFAGLMVGLLAFVGVRVWKAGGNTAS